MHGVLLSLTIAIAGCSSSPRTPLDGNPRHETQSGERNDRSLPRLEVLAVDRTRDALPQKGPKTLWVSTAGGEQHDGEVRCQLDPAGAAYVGGEFVGTMFWGSTVLNSKGDQDIFAGKLDVSGKLVWSRSVGSTATDHGFAVAADAGGNLYLSGSIGGDAAFGATVVRGGPLSLFLAKLDPAGTFLWARGANTPVWSGAVVGVDPKGHVRVAGSFPGTLELGESTLQAAGSDDCYVARFDPAGQLVWAISGGGAGNESCQDLALDSQGNSYVAGFTASGPFKLGSLTAGPGPFVAKLDPSGSPLFVTGEWTGSYYSPILVAVDPSGGASIAGTFYSKATLGTNTITPAGGTDTFVARLVNGKVGWAASAGGQGNDPAAAIAVDTKGNTYVTGTFGALGAGSATFGAITVKSVANSGDVFVAKYDPNGQAQWVATAGGDELDGGSCVTVGANGEILVGGEFRSRHAIIGGQTLTPRGDSDVFFWKFLPPDM